MSPDVADYFGYPQSASGVAVDERLALTYAAVYAAVRVIAESVAQLPIGVYGHIANGKAPRFDHPAYRLLNVAPNDDMAAFTFRETLTSHVCTWGNGYAEIERTGGGNPVALHPLRPDRVKPKRIGRRLVYDVTRENGGQPDTLDSADVLHVAGLGFDGVQGYSPIRMHRNAIGHGMAAETYSARFFGNGARPGGIIKVPGPLNEVAAKKLRQSYEAMHAGPDAAHRVAIFDDGADFQELGINPEDSQLLATRKFSVTEIARIFRVPPHMIGDLERATFANIEQQSLDFLIFSLMPWLVRWEQEVRRKLFMPSEENLFAQHQTSALLRADTKSRYEAYAIARQWGWMSANDVREAENENPLPDSQGDIYLVPMNMASAKAIPDAAEKVAQANRGVLLDAARRMLRKEIAAARKAAAQPATFRAWVDSFYAKHEDVFAQAIAPAMEAIRAQNTAAPEPLALTRRHVATARQALLDAADRSTPETLTANVCAILDAWEVSRADELFTQAQALAA